MFYIISAVAALIVSAREHKLQNGITLLASFAFPLHSDDTSLTTVAEATTTQNAERAVTCLDKRGIMYLFMLT